MQKFDFLDSFSTSFTKNHWSNTDKSIESLKEIIFPYLEMKKYEKDYPKEQHSLIIMHTFKGQDSDILKELYFENNCEIAMVPHNLTNKF